MNSALCESVRSQSLKLTLRTKWPYTDTVDAQDVQLLYKDAIIVQQGGSRTQYTILTNGEVVVCMGNTVLSHIHVPLVWDSPPNLIT